MNLNSTDSYMVLIGHATPVNTLTGRPQTIGEQVQIVLTGADTVYAGRIEFGIAGAVSLDVSSGELTGADGPHPATLVVDPSGSNNALLFTAVANGIAGRAVSVAMASPVTSQLTAVSVSGNDITITPGTKARMTIGGTLNGGATVFPVLLYAGTKDGEHWWTGTGTLESPNDFELHGDCAGGMFTLYSSGFHALAQIGLWYSGTGATWPDAATGWTPDSGYTGTPALTAGISSAGQVVTACNAYGACSDLVTAANNTGNDGTGAVAAVAKANLTGGDSGIVAFNLDGLDFEGNKITELVLLKALQFRVSNTVAVALTQSGGGTLNLTVERAACFASANLLSRWMDHPVVITAPAPCTVWITAAGGPSS